MKSTPIPASSRAVVKQRAHGRCERCGVPAARGHWHHRRSRSVRDDHTHCACNGVWVCGTCHVDVHAQPFEARKKGFIVSRHIDEPSTVSVLTPWGERHHDCTGGFTFTQEQP